MDPDQFLSTEEQFGIMDCGDSEEDELLGDASVVVGLNPTGDAGNNYHLLNNPAQPYQRETAVERRGMIEIQCKSREIVHGFLSSSSGPDDEDADSFATLLVYDIHMNAQKASRRIVSAMVEFEFRSSESGAPDPKVQKIAPFRRVGVLSTEQEETKTVGGELSISGGPEGIASVGLTGMVEKSVSKTTTDEARVTGSIWSDDYGSPAIARWVLNENRSAKSGVPNFLRVAILLARPQNNLFESRVTIKAEADWKSNFKSSIVHMFGSTPSDDPILFDPSLKPTNKLRKTGYDTDNLGELDLNTEFVDIRFSTVFSPGKKLLD